MPKTNVLVLNGSPHRGRGVTGSLLPFFIHGMESEGANVDALNIYDLDVQPCRGCLGRWHTSPGRCIQEDDVREVLSEIADSDVLVLATPVYVDGMTGPMKTLLDRTIPLRVRASQRTRSYVPTINNTNRRRVPWSPQMNVLGYTK